MQALGYGWLFFYWRNILAWSPSVEQKPKECELKNISSTSGKLGLFWVRQPSESGSPEEHPARGDAGECQCWNGHREHWRCWIIWFFLRKSESCSTRSLLTQPAWLILFPACDFPHFLSRQSFSLLPHKPSPFGRMDTFSITRFSLSGVFFSSFCSSPAYQVWTNPHCLFKAWAHTQTQIPKRLSKNKIHHSQKFLESILTEKSIVENVSIETTPLGKRGAGSDF